MAKIYATFSLKGGELKLVDGPDGDYQKHRSSIMEARAAGLPEGEELWMVDLKVGLGAGKLAKGSAKQAASSTPAPPRTKKQGRPRKELE